MCVHVDSYFFQCHLSQQCIGNTLMCNSRGMVKLIHLYNGLVCSHDFFFFRSIRNCSQCSVMGGKEQAAKPNVQYASIDTKENRLEGNIP